MIEGDEEVAAFENEGSNREVGQTDPSGASVPRSLPNYYARVKNTYAKGSFADCFRKPFGCPKCGRCFTVKGNMTRHLKYECGQAPRFQCPYCEFRSKQTSNVMSHIRTRHTDLSILDSLMSMVTPGNNMRSDRSLFYCPKCLHGFTLKSNRNRHYKYECGHKPRFQCPYCELKSKQTSQIYCHIRKKHPNERVCVIDLKF
ncbi:hypothetical protein E2986_07640 [Frieseomelitta varia]|uniref:C2H2-type domain-containing protein n=1 Tax=Frieseomelitta varia TaxID=561572 RepID=A0A833RUV9_9HYME|nr:hypothetical protein E2986_07640 [Frieseomelitta varia]